MMAFPTIARDPEHATIYLEFSDTDLHETVELSRGVYLDVDEDDVLEAMEMGKSYQALSMDHSLEADSDGSTVTLFDVVGQEDDGYEKADQRMLVAEAMNVLSEREKQIIQFTYIEQLSQKEAGDKLGISQMHVSRLQRKAIKKLQEAILAAGGVS